uniref:Uncharacterized protein n=1 Tax=Avena sativa TaxID=4498 RepID=A0ACD5X5J4_AVESA
MFQFCLLDMWENSRWYYFLFPHLLILSVWMNVSTNHSQDYLSQYGAPPPQEEEEELDEDGEGLVQPQGGGRAANYTTEEDKLLCKAWCNVGMHPMVGADQSRETYWVHIKEYFDGDNTSGIERTERSLRSRWGVINADCQKWAGVQKHVDELNPSGNGDFDRLTVAQNL